MRHLTLSRNLLALALALVCAWASAGIVYNEAVSSIIVDDYPETLPCNLREIYIADKMNGWGKVEYNKATDTYTINASLVVGRDNGTDTYMRIGAAENPNESLLLKGHLVVHPFGLLEDKQARERRINRLTIGDERDTGARPSLKLAGKGVFVGSALSSDGKKLRGAGGELRLYNCIISGSGAAPEQAAGPCDLSGWRCSFSAVNVEFRNFKDAPIVGIHAYMEYAIEQCVFKDCGAGFAGASCVLKFKNCSFKNFKGPVFMSSPHIELANCAFEGNAMNWDLSRGGYMKCVDCSFGAAAKTNLYGIGPNPKTKQDERAFFLDMRHVIVQALDTSGAPVTNAKVAVRAETEADADQDHSITKTGGLTPGKGQDSALLLTKTRIESDGKGGASSKDYSYSIMTTHKEKTGTVKGFKPSASWETVVITLHE